MSINPALSPNVLWGSTLAFIAMAVYGVCMVTVATAAKGMSSGPGSLLAAAAGVPIGIVIVLMHWASGHEISVPTPWSIVAFALAGICSTYLGRWLVFKSIEVIGPSGSAGMQSISPLITVVFGWIFLGEVIGTIGFVGIALGIAGLLAMSMGIGRSQRKTAQSASAVRTGPWRGFISATLLIGVGSAAAYSLSHVFRASGVRQWNEALLGALIGALAGLLVLALTSYRSVSEYVRQVQTNPKAARVYLGVGGFQFLAQAMVIASMKYIPASMAALISMCTPLVVLPVSYFALRNDERLSWVTVLGIAITLAGITLVVLYGAPAS
ncbi:MAG: DMT family transporter [Burkholderiaceae bacterium]|nr:DMT family transporter [Burkholderiaceae bacterium]MDP3753338.1 DMT family transporter [Polaromonas sp.]